MLCDIIGATVDAQNDMELVGEAPGRARLMEIVDRTRADVVVVGVQNSELPQECATLFTAFPDLCVLGIVAEGRCAFLWELRPQGTALGELAPQALVEEIRAAACVHRTLP